MIITKKLIILLLIIILLFFYLDKSKENFNIENNNIYPIIFSIPEEKIVKNIPFKTKLISNLIPGDTSTYIYNTENDYYKEYQKSIFAKTIMKAGWDCMRHYEILANGTIPYFPNIENCPKNTMALFPKELVMEGNNLYNKLKDKNINELTISEKEECNKLAEKLLKFTKENLTTKNIAKYILNSTNNLNAKNILFLSVSTYPDYLRCLTLHGFKELFGKNCHDYPKVTHIYKNENYSYNTLYGKGFTYSNLLDNTLHDDSLDNTIENDIINNKYDIIIYGSYHRGTPHFDLVNKYYPPEKIILLCGEDYIDKNYNDYHINHHKEMADKKYNIFVREM